MKTTTDTAIKLCMYIKLNVKYTCSSICTYFESLKAIKNLHFSQRKKDKSKAFHTLTHNNLKTTTDTAMTLCMYIKLSVKYTFGSICSYFESDRVLKSAKSSLFTAEKGRVYMLKKTWYSNITFIIHKHTAITGLQGCDFRSQLTWSTSDFPVNTSECLISAK